MSDKGPAVWEKQIGPRGGSRGGWREDFPLSRDLPRQVVVDCSALKLPIHPMFAVRLEVFRAWLTSVDDHEVRIVVPDDAAAAGVFAALGLGVAAEDTAESILPVTHLLEYGDVDEAAGRVRAILEYDRPDISALGSATYMAVAELCGNAVEHGANPLGSFVAALRQPGDQPRVQLAIGDLGIGIPEHLRQHLPEWADDTAAIGKAMDPSVSGTGDPHRGNGFTETFDAALTSALHAAKIEVHSANGFLRTNVVQENRTHETFPAPRFRRGTWITYELVSV